MTAVRSHTVPIVEKFVERAKAVREWSASQRQGTDLIVQPKPPCLGGRQYVRIRFIFILQILWNVLQFELSRLVGNPHNRGNNVTNNTIYLHSHETSQALSGPIP